MGIKSYLHELRTGIALAVAQTSFGPVLCVEQAARAAAVFNTLVFTAQDTYILADSKGDSSIELTDLIVSAEKKNLGTLIVRFNDGTQTETIANILVTEVGVNLAIAFRGKWQGWRSAQVELVIGGADFGGSVAIGYTRHNKANSLAYSDWNARR